MNYLDFLGGFLLDGFEVGTEIHGDLVFGTKEGFQHLVGGHLDTSQRRALEFTAEIEDLLVQFLDLC